MNAPLCIALVGNPNAGKTTAFNTYTGSHQHVGNYPGVTVDKKEGTLHLDGEAILLLDLPGTYSLTAYSQEELVTRGVLLTEHPLAVLDVVDASALERNLLLTVQIMEMGLPVVLACNMMDEARRAGLRIDVDLLGKRLGIPVLETVARTGEGLEDALRAAVAFGRSRQAAVAPAVTAAPRTGALDTQAGEPLRLSYGPDMDPALLRMERIIADSELLQQLYAPRWLALKLLEGDECISEEARAANPQVADQLHGICMEVTAHVRATLHTAPESIIADFRYGFIRSLLRDGVLEQHDAGARLALTDTLDRVLTNAFFGPLIMLGVLFILFQLTFSLGGYPQGWVESAFALLSDGFNTLLPEGLLKSLVVNGIIAGVGGVIGFVPLIMIMFLLIAFLEDSGYMARIAYMLDRLFRAFGLHGCSVMPYIISGGIAGGCAIPGVMATRTLRSPKEKLATLLTLPYMACGAKLPVFLLLTGIFFPENAALTMFLLTLSGWVAALVVARLLRSTIIRGDATPFVMELPPYRLPTLRSLGIHCWERTWMYLKKAGTVLVAISILIWAGMTFPALDAQLAAPFEQTIAMTEQQLLVADPAARPALEDALTEAQSALAAATLRHSYAGRLGTAIEPYTLPAGFDWRTDIALLGGIAAKEAIVSTLGTAYSLGEQDPDEATSLAALIARDPNWNKGTALSLMLFVLLYSPCFVALVVIRHEAGSWGWVAFSLLFNTGLAFGVAVSAYQIGRFIWPV